MNEITQNKKKSVRDVLKATQESPCLGLVLYKASKDVVAMYQSAQARQSALFDKEAMTLGQKNSVIYMRYALYLLMPKGERDIEDFKAGLYDFLLPNLADKFLIKNPTPSIAQENFPRPAFLPQDEFDAMNQILDLTVDEANELILAKPLVRNFKDNFNAAQMIESPKAILPEIEDPTDQRIWGWIKENPSITDTDIAQKLKVSRQTVNTRRRILISMGYPAKRTVSRQKR